MGIQAISILTEGIWASLTGGYYYDGKQSHISNLFHLYIWLAFFCCPFVNYLFFNTWISWLFYCLFIAIIFIIVKLINEYFHRVFDTGKCIKDETNSSCQDPVLNSLMCNDGESAEKETLEMVTISHNSHLNNSANNDQNQKDKQGSEVQDNPNDDLPVDDNGSNEITSKTIDLKADVHCNDTESSYGNLSLLFRSENEPRDNNETFPVNEAFKGPDDANKLASSSQTTLDDITHMPVLFPKGDSNNSVGVLDNLSKLEQTHTFRRARSEIETIKRSDKQSKTELVPPSHPVSMEIINSKITNEDKNVPLDKSRFKKDAEIRNKYYVKPKGFQWDENEPVKMSRIEENNEKAPSCSSAYIKKECDSSEDGDESEVSLCTNDSVKIKPSINKKLAKQPMRKTRFTNNRKRSKLPSVSGTSRTEWTGKSFYHELDHRCRPRLNTIVTMNSSDDDEPENKHPRQFQQHVSNRFQYNSDSSSSLPSSSSSTTSRDIKKGKVDMDVFQMNFPSTSSGISRASDRKRFRNKYSKVYKYLTVSGDGVEEDASKKYDRLSRIRKHLKENVGHENVDQLDSDFLKCLYQINRNSRSNSIRDEESAKNSVVCIPNSPNIIGEILSTPGTHLATSHEDTTIGAVHVFQDERGNWFSYTFEENSPGVAKGLCPQNPFSKLPSNETGEKLKSSGALIASNSIYFLNHRLSSGMDPNAVILNNNNNINLDANRDKVDVLPWCNGGQSSHTPDSIQTNPRNMFEYPFAMLDPNSDVSQRFHLDASIASDFISSLNNQSFSHSFQRSQQQLKPSQYYEVKIFNLKTCRIRFDRLALLAFMDRNLTTCELIFSIILAILVALFASILLSKEFFHDIRLFVFCFVVAGSQYTLLKSVQPDAASPTHGFNRIAIYSRPIYFCLVAILILVSNEYYHKSQSMDPVSFDIYGFNIVNRDLFSTLSNISQILILIFPLLFMFGLLPQFNTFLIYIFEHIDIHVFGGTASTIGMISATYSIIRSILAVGFLYLCAHLFNIKETQRASFSVFCGILAAISYLFSRSPSDPSLLWNALCQFFNAFKNFFIRLITNSKLKSSNSGSPNQTGSSVKLGPKLSESEVLNDPLPEKLKNIAVSRFESDFISCIFVAISVFSVHVSSIFKLQPFFNNYITVLAIYWSFVLHYMIPQFRKQLPWLFFSSPICKSHEYKKFEVKEPAKNMWFEKIQAWLWIIEKNIIYPVLFLGYITTDCPMLIKNYSHNMGLFLLVLCGFKCLRSSYNDPSHNYIIVVFTHLFFGYDFRFILKDHDNIFLFNYFVMSFFYYKVTDFLLKFRFVITYVAPWQITWGSAFHAFAQPFSVPHSALLLVQIFISSLLSSPLQPILGSAIFFTSYVRPIKFWERDYNTKRVDHSNTRLASQIDKAQIGSDDNNLNSIFYEHLTRSLQHSLYGDLILGRWGDVSQGDCFVLASDNLNCLIHIIELGNGFVTFQVRGLEFRGTYCQQREVEAITENVSDDGGCCCCETGRVAGLLSVNAAFNQRWLSWEVTHSNYILEGYSISEHMASTIVQPYDLRKALITYYVKSIIYFCITYENFLKWIENEEIKQSLSYLNDKNFVDLDPTFNSNIDEDFDIMMSGITRSSFKNSYLEWIKYCIDRGVNPAHHETVKKNEESVITLCFGLSLLARRALGTASHHNSALMNVEFFLYGFHSLFKGDFRIHCSRDEWVFQDMDFLNKIVSPSVRMSLKLHQDKFINYEYEDSARLFDSITQYRKSMVISHEADPIWRKAILSNVPSLLALRHVFDEGAEHYKVIMLNKRFLNFRINRECVRGLWAGQQQELIFLRNRNPERGSIQNAKQVLRNIINSSCDQPIGYPIYVSPLTTSFSETSTPLNQIIFPSPSFSMFKRAIVGFFNKIRNRCNEVCTSGSRANDLNFATASRLTKSESSDRGLEDSNSAKGSLIVSTHSQIVQFSNYSQFLKKRVVKNDEEAMHHSLVNLPSNRNVISLLQNSLNMPTEPMNVVNPCSNKATVSLQPTDSPSLANMEHPKSLIVEKGFIHPKGDAV